MKAPSGRLLNENSAGEKLLKRMTEVQRPFIAIDVLDAFTAKILNSYQDVIEGFWISSLGYSTRLGFQDVYNLSPRDYLEPLEDISLIKNDQHFIVDADNGGQSYKNTEYTFKLLSTLNVSLGIVENKRGVKFNSVDKNASKLHELEDNELFAAKINKAKLQNNTLVGIRIENGIVHDDDPAKALQSSLDAVDYFYEHSRPDIFVFHWKLDTAETPINFASEYMKKFPDPNNRPLLACIPTTYSKNTSNCELYSSGFNLIIYGNPLLRAQLSSVITTLESIKKNDSLRDVDKMYPSVDEVFKLSEK
jgi:2-methylisocitrate lyase-like PEP mutase family enzyme